MKYKNITYLALSAVCLLMAFLLSMSSIQKREEALASHIAPEVIRFHVLANSDSSEDQALKLEVKEMLLSAMYDDLGSSISKEETKNYIRTYKNDLETAAEDFMKEKGYDYTANVALTNDYFPTKAYGDVVFPSGTYEACRVTIGEGKGKNWWCVLYPPLCFIEPTYAVVPDNSKEMLEAVLPEDDFAALMSQRRLMWNRPASYDENPAKDRIEIKFLLFE